MIYSQDYCRAEEQACQDRFAKELEEALARLKTDQEVVEVEEVAA